MICFELFPEANNSRKTSQFHIGPVSTHGSQRSGKYEAEKYALKSLESFSLSDIRRRCNLEDFKKSGNNRKIVESILPI